MNLTVVYQNKREQFRDVQKVNVPTPQGYITILPNHDRLISVVDRGVLRIHTPEETYTIEVEGGILKVNQNQISLLLD